MKRRHIILVADRNPRIRDFVQRELKSEGHCVLTAESVEGLNRWLDRPSHLDALVIDPSMLGLDDRDPLRFLLSLRPDFPVVFHCQSSDRPSRVPQSNRWVFVEKNGQSVDEVKSCVRRLLESSAGPEDAPG